MAPQLEDIVLINGVEGKFLTAKDFMDSTSHHTRVFPETPGDEIVVSGVSGRYPSCDNVEEFSHNLYNKVSMKFLETPSSF